MLLVACALSTPPPFVRNDHVATKIALWEVDVNLDLCARRKPTIPIGKEGEEWAKRILKVPAEDTDDIFLYRIRECFG